MRIRGIWQDASSYQKLMIFIMLIFSGAFVFTAIAAVIIKFIYGFNLLTDSALLSGGYEPAVLGPLKIMQILSATGTFIIPALLAGILFSFQPAGFLSLDKKPALSLVLSTAAIVIVSTPLVNYLMIWNQHLSLPGFLKTVEEWMQEAEAKAAGITEAFMKMNSVSDLAINMFMIALIPAFGEELIFRGVIQKLLKNMVKNSFIAILLTSVLFSAIHLQFYGFLPRMALGILLGYLLEWSRSLWLPILLHFLNNGAAVLISYFYPNLNMDRLGTDSGDMWQLLLSCILTAAFILFIYLKSEKYKLYGEKIVTVKNI